MIIIANPIYDVVFKYFMEDEKVARILLSALLKKEIISIKMRRHEYTAMQQSRISLYRIDFSACVREADGQEQLILIELQKTWLATETLRFRQYLGTQYINKENMVAEAEVPYGLPIVSIYILGHKLGELTEPVIYVRRYYLDHNDQVIPATDRFIESLTHDSIIVQIPYLKGRTRTRLERILNLFDQDYIRKNNEHYLEIDDSAFEGEEQLLVKRLLCAAATPEIRRAMEVEDEILSEIEARDTTIMIKNREIEQKEQEIEKKEQEIEQKEQMLHKTVLMLYQNGISIGEIARQLSLPEEEIKRMIY